MLAAKVKTKIKVIFQVIVLTETCTKCIYTYIERERQRNTTYNTTLSREKH